MFGSIAAVAAGVEASGERRTHSARLPSSNNQNPLSESNSDRSARTTPRTPLQNVAVAPKTPTTSPGGEFLVSTDRLVSNASFNNHSTHLNNILNTANGVTNPIIPISNSTGLGITGDKMTETVKRLHRVRLNDAVDELPDDRANNDAISENGSWFSDNDSIVETTILESYLEELIVASAHMAPWRARMFLLFNAGTVIPFKMMDIDLVTSAYMCLAEQHRHRLAQINLNAAISVARVILLSKLMNFFFLCIVLLAILLLCITTMPELTITNFRVIFVLESLCMFFFLVEIIIQCICLHRHPANSLRSVLPATLQKGYKYFLMVSTITLTDRKVHRITTGIEPQPKHFRFITNPNGRSNNNNATTGFPKESNDTLGATTPNELERLDERAKRPVFVHLNSEQRQWTWIFIDVIATLPFLIEGIVLGANTVSVHGTFDDMLIKMYSWNNTSDWFAILRLLRTLRLTKIGQKSEKVRLLWRAITNSMDGILMLLVALPMFLIFMSFYLFYAEQFYSDVIGGVWYYPDGSKSVFQSVADAMWLLMATVTTTGYGDVVPKTALGKLTLGIAMFLSLFIVAFPLTLITMQYSHHARLFSEQKRAHAEAIRELHERLVADEAVLFKPTNVSPPSNPSPDGIIPTPATASTVDLNHMTTRSMSHFNTTTARSSFVKLMNMGDYLSASTSSTSRGKADDDTVTPKVSSQPSHLVNTLFQIEDVVEDRERRLSMSPMSETPPAILHTPSALSQSITATAAIQVPPRRLIAHRRSVTHFNSTNRSHENLSASFESSTSDNGVTTEEQFVDIDTSRVPSAFQSLPSFPPSFPPPPQKSRSVGPHSGFKDIEKEVDAVLLDKHPKTVVVKVQDWKLEYREERREDVLTVRVRCRDEDAYRRLMKVLADFG
ncbi:hypothetical protein BJ741DRAFT_620802 [Chytriomyces cf. hyalinus JEL632]|nr:hypothetical protein BJ741DRAFT_620802 [Chytriomyces cf. hyalinus JEL632]